MRTLPVLTEKNAQSRLYYLRVITALSFIAGIALSHKLWIGALRSFPAIPLIDGLSVDELSVEYALTPLLIITLISSALSKRPRPYLIATIALAATLIMLDQMRLQPWVYQYLIMLAALICLPAQSKDEAPADHCLAANQIVVAALYFWGGIQKMNWTFCHEVVSQLLEPHLGITTYLPAIGLGIAIFEALIGIGLLIRKTRQMAVALAIGMHALILTSLISRKQNSVVWPWNIGMTVMVPILFWRAETDVWKLILSSEKSNLRSHFAKVVLIVCGLLPAFSFIGLWDLYLSAALYSGGASVAVVHLSDRVRNQLPLQAQSQIFTTEQGELMLPFYEWSMTELNVPPYPEARVYRRLARRLCRHADDPREVELIVKETPAIFTGNYIVKRADCRNLISE